MHQAAPVTTPCTLVTPTHANLLKATENDFEYLFYQSISTIILVLRYLQCRHSEFFYSEP